MLTAIPKNIFSSDFHIERDGERVAFLDLAIFRRKGVIELGSDQLRVETKGAIHPEFSLFLNDSQIAQARKPAMLKDVFELVLGDVVCEIRRRSIFRRQFFVLHEGQQVGEISPIHWYSFKARIDLPDDWPLGLQVFVFWIVVRVWKRDASNNGGS